VGLEPTFSIRFLETNSRRHPLASKNNPRRTFLKASALAGIASLFTLSKPEVVLADNSGLTFIDYPTPKGGGQSWDDYYLDLKKAARLRRGRWTLLRHPQDGGPHMVLLIMRLNDGSYVMQGVGA
jgi:hypothetical protein